MSGGRYPLARKTTWSFAQSVAWVAGRRQSLVHDVGAMEAAQRRTAKGGRARDPLLLVVAQVALDHSPASKPYPAAKDIADAADTLRAEELAGHIRADSSGRYRAAILKSIFPAKAGRGNKLVPHDREKLHILAAYFRTTAKGAQKWDAHLAWCKAQIVPGTGGRRLVSSRNEYAELRKLALKFAAEDLERLYAGARLEDMGSEEYDRCSENIASWRKGGRPKKT